MMPTGSRVGLGVSGGADSMALLHALKQLGDEFGWRLEVIHVNHRSRGGASDEDAAFVSRAAQQLGLPFHLAERDVSGEAAGENWEQVARRVRYEEFARWRSATGGERVATAHTRSDQAETVLFRLLRGTGWQGLSGVLPVTREGIVRPLLEVSRAEVEGFLRSLGVTWREDASNRDLARSRNRLRHELLPQLREQWNPQIDEALAHLATLSQGEAEYWDTEVAREWGRVARPYRGGWVMDVGGLLGQPLAVRRRLVRYGSERVLGRERPVDFEHVEAILSLAEQGEGHGRLQASGLDVFRSFGWLWLAPAGSGGEGRLFREDLEPGQEAAWPDGERRIALILHENSSPDNWKSVDHIVDWDRLPGPLVLRTWTPGDELRVAGSAAGVKIKLLFQEGRIPLWERRFWPVLECGGRIVWSRKFGAAAEAAVSAGTTRILEIRELEEPVREKAPEIATDRGLR